MNKGYSIVVLLVFFLIETTFSQEIWSPVHPVGIKNPVTLNDTVLLSGVASSKDGINWNIGQPDTSIVLSAGSGIFAYGSTYYAASYSGHVWYTSDLKKWSYRKIVEDKKIIDLILNKNRFLMITDDYGERYLYTGRAISGMDSVAQLPDNVNSLYICGTKMYVIGDSATYSSTDSVNWNLETENSFTKIVNTPICNIGLKSSITLSIADSGSDLWSDVNVDIASSEVILDVVYCNSKLFAITGSQSYTSIDTGKTWQKLSNQADHPKLKDLYHIKKSGDLESTLYGSGDYLNGSIFTFNSENNQWINVAEGMQDTIKNIRGLVNNDSIIVGVCSKNVIITSNDSGATWSSINFSNHYMRSYPVFFKDSFYVLSKIEGSKSGGSDTNVILTSGNGIDWNIKECDSSHNFYALGVHQNKIIAGARGKVWTSEDGISWDVISVPIADGEGLHPEINCIASNGRTIACIYDYTGWVIYSQDLVTWNKSITNSSDPLDIYPDMITSNGTNFVAASSAEHQTSMLDTSGRWTDYPYSGTDYGLHFRIGNEYAAAWHYLFSFSKDGISGRKEYSAPFSSPEGFCYMGDRLIVAAYNGIYTSKNVNGVIDPVSTKPISVVNKTIKNIIIKQGTLFSKGVPIKNVSLYTMNGRVVFEKDVHHVNKIKLPSLASGVYKVSVTFKNNTFGVISYVNIR